MAKVKFIGGPLNGQKKRMDVYTHVIPVPKYGYDSLLRPRGYYCNVLTDLVTSDLHNQMPTLYVFHINGVPLPTVTKDGKYVQ